MATALASIASGRKVPHTMAMTGEVTLRGRVLPVGGIRQKVNGAHRAGITDVVLPALNMRDLEEIPEEIRGQIRFHPVRTLEEALKLTLLKPGARRRKAATAIQPPRPGGRRIRQEIPQVGRKRRVPSVARAERTRHGSRNKP
jgi:ATP-dependent Lon protease